MTGEQFLKGQVALVTGGGVRVGRALALALADNGATVALHYNRSESQAKRVALGIRRRGGQAATFQADLASDIDCAELVPKVHRELGPVRILVNNASVFGTGRFETTTLHEWDENLDLNLRVPFILSQSMAAQNRGRMRGSIINLSDWRGLRPGADHFAYTVAKAALVKMTEAMALSLGPRIRVNCLALGSILLPKGASARLKHQLASVAPVKRMGSPRDVAAAMLYLLGPGSFVTGETLLVDGGRSLVH